VAYFAVTHCFSRISYLDLFQRRTKRLGSSASLGLRLCWRRIEVSPSGGSLAINFAFLDCHHLVRHAVEVVLFKLVRRYKGLGELLGQHLATLHTQIHKQTHTQTSASWPTSLHHTEILKCPDYSHFLDTFSNAILVDDFSYLVVLEKVALPCVAITILLRSAIRLIKILKISEIDTCDR
jgi:hypothetical protein